MRVVLVSLLEALFRVLFAYQCEGEENVPQDGPAIVAANHPSYLDPILLSLQVSRPIHFMAWDALFGVPFLGSLIRLFGAFPVDTRKGKGLEAYARARRLVEQGELVGIFPEGRRSRTGWMEPSLREGAARLALETSAPLVPATITGAYRAWPQSRPFPRPASIRVRFHAPIDPKAFAALPREEAVDALIAELRRRVERSLLPGVKRDLRMSVAYAKSAPWPRLYEALPALAMATLVFWKTHSWMSVAPAYAYVAYLLLDRFLLLQSRFVKLVRNASAAVFVMLFETVVRESLGLPRLVAGSALAAVCAAGLFPYLYERSQVAIGAVRGAVFASIGSLIVAGAISPSPLGPQVAVPLLLSAYAWDRQSVYWRWATPLLALYATFVPLSLGGGFELLPHATVGLAAWAITRFFPYQNETVALEPPEEPRLGLQL